MIASCLLKPRFKSILFIIFVTLHLSACSTEDFLAAITPEIGSDTEADITGINLTAKINGVDSGNVIEDSDPDGDNLLEVSGKLDITDNDPGEEAFIAKTINGDYGIFDIDTAGNWNYAAGNQQSAIQNLASNATLTENLVVSSVDGTTHTVKITIIGVIDSGNLNNAAVITGNDLSNIQEDLFTYNNQVRSIGKLNITDNDAGQAAFIGVTINGNYGALNIDISGNWFYVLNNSLPAIQSLNDVDSVKDTLVISSVDGTTHNITITIWGANEVNQTAIITGVDTGTVTEDVDPDGDDLLEISGKLNITDSDAGEGAFTVRTVNGNYGSLTINTTGNWNYAAANNQSLIQNLATGATLTENLVVSSVDGTTHNITITIWGANEVNQTAIITGVDTGTVTEDVDPDGDDLLEISGKLNITDSDAGEAAFTARTVTGNNGSLTINTTGNWNYAANNNQAAIQNLVSGATLIDRLNVNSVDGTAHTVAITILGTDESNTPADITLSWVAPAEREDNSALSLSAIAGYKVYYGTTQGQYSNSVAINDGTAVAYTFTGLPAGTYYFVVTTLDTEGRESQYSTEVVIII